MTILLCACALLFLLGARPAQAQSTTCVGTYGGTIDGNFTPVPSNLQVDGPCTIKNYPASNPYFGNISLLATRGTLVIFDNVDFIGNISCDLVHQNIVWFVNGSITRQHILKCTNNVFVQTDKIDKQNPPGPPFVQLGVPFTYTFTFPQQYDPLTGRVTDPNGSAQDVSQVTVTDDLNATGVSLSYVSSTATWKATGAPVPFSVSNVGGVLTFSGFPTIPAGQQIVLQVTVVLTDNVPPNSPGTSFVNTANWQLGTTIGGVYYYPLPGQQGVTAPLTIVAPTVVMTKTGPATMSVGQLGRFGLNIQNTGTSDVWNATITDRLPTGATGGMCAAAPQILSAQVFQSDGVTPAPGKGPLALGTDYTVSWAGTPTCTLTINLLTAAATIGPTQRLIITYQTQLDPNTQNGVALTNVAGATQWYSFPPNSPQRQSYTCPLTNGTPGVADCQDAHTVNVANPAVTVIKQVTVDGGGPALAGATLDYTVHVTNTSNQPVTPVVITDDLNAAGAGALTYVAGSATMNGSATGVTVTNNVITGNYSATYGPLAAGASVDLRFKATLGATLAPGTVVTNTGKATWGTPPLTSSGSVSVIVVGPAVVMTKGGPATMSLGQPGRFTLNLQNTGTSDVWNATILDRLPTGATGGMCATAPQILSAQVFQADGVTPVPGKGPLVAGTDYTVAFAGPPTCTLTISLLSAAADISPTQRLIITYQTQLDPTTQPGATLTNVAGATQWYSGPASDPARQSYTCTLTNGTPGIADCQDAHTVTVPVPAVTVTKQVSVVGGGAPVPGATLAYDVHLTNTSTQPVTPVVITDDLNAAGAGALTYVVGSATMNGAATGITVTNNVITANYSATYGPLAPGASVDLRFQATLGTTLAAGTTVTNTGVATWGNPAQTSSGSASIVVVVPNVVMTKGGPATMVLGTPATFSLNVQNVGSSDVWNATIVDRLPTGATGGMCATPPKILTAQVFQSDGVTPVPGKGPLVLGTDYTTMWVGTPTCTLTISLVTAAAVISPTQRLIITYQTQLDPTTQSGASLTNIAGATQWYSGPSSDTTRQSYTCTLTNGTPGVADCQDAHTVTVPAAGVIVTKQVTVVGGGPPVPGATLAYLVHVTNTTAAPVTPVVITDDLNAAGAGALTYVVGSAQMNGAATGITVTNNVITANYSGTYGPLAAGASVDLSFRATLGAKLAPGTTVTNTAVATWGNPAKTSSGSVSVIVVAPNVVMTKSGPATLSVTQVGSFTLNIQNTGTSDVWNATVVDELPTGATGGMCATAPKILTAQVFQSDGVTPVPGKGPLVAGTDYSFTWVGAPTCTLTINFITAAAVISPSQRLIITYQAQLDPTSQNGITLTNVAGATKWYSGPASDTTRQTYTCTLTNGTPGVPDCQDAHTLTVVGPALAITKQVTVVGGGPPLPGATLAYVVHVVNTSAQPATPVVITDDLNAAGAGALTYVAGSATMNGFPAGVSVTNNVITANYSATYGPLAPGATIDLSFRATLGALPAGTSVTNVGVATWGSPPQSVSGRVTVVVNLPPGALVVSKITPLIDVTRGQLVPYTITITDVLTGPVQGAALVDRYPAGFRYVKGSARLDGVPAEPTVALAGFTLTWGNLNFVGGGHHTIVLLLAVGAGVGEGEFVNRAQALAGINGPAASKEATATVRVVPDRTFDCTDVIGKVFDDANGNGRQDPGEKGLPGVRVVTTRGLAAVTDQYGRFHITCAITPLEGRGSNFTLKLDERTLPSGYRPTTPEVLVERATRGKALRFEFGATIHHVVSLDLSDAAFEPGTADLRPQWQGRMELLLAELHKVRSVLRLSYLADVEEPRLVEKRVEAIAASIQAAWKANSAYELNIEREIFWLRGGPPKEPVERLRGAQ